MRIDDTRIGAGPSNPITQPARRTPVIIRHLGMRGVDLDEIVAALGGLGSLEGVPIEEIVDTGRFAEDVDAGNWGPSHGEVWRRAREIRERLRSASNPRVIYAGGMPEVAHAIAFGAYLEEQWEIEFYDFHNGALVWPSAERTLDLGDATGLPLDMMTTAGPAVLRVEISYRVTDEQIRQFVSAEEQVADVRIAPAADPRPGLVRSPADVAEIRRAVSHAITTLVERRPKLTTIHLFVAAPVSACVVIGQELRLRNHPAVQTYRHRRDANGASQTTEALRLTSHGPAVADIPLTPEQSARAEALRSELWAVAIGDLERYAERKQREARRDGARAERHRWYDGLPWADEIKRLRPFPALPPVEAMVKRPARVANESFEREGFGFQREDRVWRINDGFSVRLFDKFPDEIERRALVRVFLFHEYLHEVHGITKESYREIGKFPNALERADYMCDLYGVLHEVDLEADADHALHADFERYKRRVGDLIDLVLRSFWVFENPAPLDELEIRRVRRYMNWYWQQVRVRRSETPLQLAAVLSRQPIVEIAGLATRAEGRRYYCSFRRLDRDVGLELAFTLDSEQVARVKSGVNTPIDELIRAFRDHNHRDIQEFFRRAYAELEMTGHVLPREEDLP
jgi:hypothetical protein